MAKKSVPQVNSQVDLEYVVERLTDEVKVLRQCLDELHESFKWAVHNGRVSIDLGDQEQDAKAPTLELFEINDAVEFEAGDQTRFGEIVVVDDGENQAIVQLIPGNEEILGDQDRLSRIKTDHQSNRPSEWLPSKAAATEHGPKPGQLF